ncbi:hypothetical protein ACLRGF_14300 [Mycetocola zhadangensis]|uniref:hypothetical protein n=1 Tax=Mycetocola zhadangensis TaxID=1164595 RepID=UPI003A4D30CA
MARTPGAKNRTPREIEKDGKAQIREAKLKRKLEAEKKKNEALKKKKATPK